MVSVVLYSFLLLVMASAFECNCLDMEILEDLGITDRNWIDQFLSRANAREDGDWKKDKRYTPGWTPDGSSMDWGRYTDDNGEKYEDLAERRYETELWSEHVREFQEASHQATSRINEQSRATDRRVVHCNEYFSGKSLCTKHTHLQEAICQPEEN